MLSLLKNKRYHVTNTFKSSLTTKSITFALNGKVLKVSNVEPGTSLLEFLRSKDTPLTGTKLSCGEGGCGACTVHLSHWDPSQHKVVHKGVLSCLAPFHSVDGHSVLTVEGIGNVTQMHPIQEQMVLKHASQCGYCTPGIVMALHSYLHGHPNATKEEIENSLGGNLCRCTGYRPILDAAKEFGSLLPSSCQDKDSECYSKRLLGGTTPEFPEELKSYKAESLSIVGKDHLWFRPSSLSELLQLKNRFPHAKIVVGSTEISIETKFKHNEYPVLIHPSLVPEMTHIKVEEGGVLVGAAASFSDMVDVFSAEIKGRPSWQTRSLQALVDQIRWFGGPQIKNVASLGGNIATASPTSDINPILLSIGAHIYINSTQKGRQSIPITQDFFVSYRKTALLQEEIIESIFIPFTTELEFVRAFKQSRRREDDIGIVSAGFRVKFKQHGSTYHVKEACLAYGGMDAITKVARKSSQYLVGKIWDLETINNVLAHLDEDLPLALDAVGGMVEYRKALSSSLWHKFSIYVSQSLGLSIFPANSGDMDVLPERPLTSGQQSIYPESSETAVGSPIVHVSAKKSVTGEAIYVDDIAPVMNTHFAHFVTSTKPKAKILSINAEKALKMEGVIAFISAKDITGINEIGIILKGEPLFATDEVLGVGYPIGLIVATSPKLAEKAALAVEVIYEELPYILTIKEAIQQSSYHPTMHQLISGGGENPETVFPRCEHVIEGEMEVGGQEHFYFEPHSTYAIPGEDNELTIYASSQSPCDVHHTVSGVLGVPSNKIVIKVKRLGGGFGGKETRSIFMSCAAAVAAKKVQKPVKLVLDRDDDMQITGGRHPFLGKYKVGFNGDGKILALDLKLYSNAGWSVDISELVMKFALYTVTNAYNVPNVSAKGYLCKTNITTNTAFRGFGKPQSLMICESWIERIAKQLNMSANEVRRKNMYVPGDTTFFQLKLEEHDATTMKCWDHILQSSNYNSRLKEVEDWNQNNIYKKRGIACIPVMYGISFMNKFLEKAGALVHVYKDGSVLLSHGGVEMGQGLHTKMIQIAATEFNIPVDKINILGTSTEIVANSSPTAGSVQSDLNGGAVLAACKIIKERIEPIRKQFPNAPWEELIILAYFNQIDLSAHGFYSRPEIDFDWVTRTGRPFAYYVTGAACSEVEIDCLTGDHQILRSDLVMDLGRSLSPAIDIGQIEGAFTQGVGWTTMEEVVYLKNGVLHSRGPGTYKIPGFKDVPIDLRVHLLKDSTNPTTIYSSKAVGEPPLLLGASVFFAIREAVQAYREQNGKKGWFYMASPATCERIRMACEDNFTKNTKT